MIKRWFSVFTLALLFVVAGCSPSAETVTVTERPERTEAAEDTLEQSTEVVAAADTIQPGRFDLGRMWTFDDPPREYFQEEYDFNPDDRWFNRARLGALRFGTYCSGSFVSPNGLVMTNHHCGRESIVKVSRQDENLLEHGFYAPQLDRERQVPDLYVDQLTQMEDVTDEVYAGMEGIDVRQTEAAARARSRSAEALQRQLTSEARERDPALHVEVVELYSGGRYSAYTYRRYDDVRLVMAPEMQLGFFGGTADNFTYPRYALDVAFFRVYDENGEPVENSYHFPWSPEGSEEGEAVFVVGNPGSTNRHSTVSQLQFLRDHALPRQLEAMEDRLEIVQDFFEQQEDTVRAAAVHNMYFALANSVKSTRGELAGLRDPELMGRRAANERQLRQQISESDTLRQRYGQAFNRIQSIQQSKRSLARQGAAYTFFGSRQIESPVLTRALYGYYLNQLQRQGTSEQRLQEARRQALNIDSWPEELDEAFMAQRFRDLRQHLDNTHPTVRRIMDDRSPEELARHLIENSALTDSAGFAQLLDEGFMQSDDPAVIVAETMGSHFIELNQQQESYRMSERDINAQLARLRYRLNDGQLPPDATFSPRISDGVVSGYNYNGTQAPHQTTFYGLYDRYFTQGHPDWTVPERWVEPGEHFDRSTPLNLVSTNDIAGGNSGSPLLNKDLEVVGVVFDNNIEALPNTYLYREDEARTISVDSRGILEALHYVYEAERLVEELSTGRLVEDDVEEMTGVN